MTPTYQYFWPGTPGGYIPVLADQIAGTKRPSPPRPARPKAPVAKAAPQPVGRPRINAARTRAAELGEAQYWNDRPCHAGHVGWRYTNNYACCECSALLWKNRSRSGKEVAA